MAKRKEIKKSPKTTRSTADERRPPEDEPTSHLINRKFDAVPDRIDIRDWIYQPHLQPLPDQVISCNDVPMILDQGVEGACTGFALAAVINFHLKRRNLKRFVSPRMLYEIARRYDEWPGEDYEGSSARGAVKGWIAHGVCEEHDWQYQAAGIQHFTKDIAQKSLANPGGSYYRVSHREVRDMHAAIVENGCLYMTLMVHQGWQEPVGSDDPKYDIVYVENGNLRKRRFPVIHRRGRATGGHAVAIVGYTHDGFIIQNSWGTDWGHEGFALLPYEDYLLHATDVWVVQLGVPVRLNLWEQAQGADVSSGLHRAAAAIPLEAIRPYVINLGNNGELSSTGRYWTTSEDIDRLITKEIPEQTKDWDKIRILLYLHGGLNSADYSARRVISYKNKMLANQIYPLNIMWETGFQETLLHAFEDLFVDADDRATGPAAWIKRFREGLLEAKDRSIEMTVALPGTALWDEMKENAKLASRHPKAKGGMQILSKRVADLLKSLGDKVDSSPELHVIGHSAGAIFAAYALDEMAKSGVPLKSIQLFAPAITVEEFKKLVVPHIENKDCPLPTLYLLSDAGERDDTVGPYGKSLLYLVSNAFEGKRETPLLGMQRFVQPTEDATEYVDPMMNVLFSKKVDELCSVVISGADGKPGERSQSNSHGGFDDDPATLNSALYRILRTEPKHKFEVRDLQF
ncbi:C1 family peptidase [Blastopirellula sp. J2-11]|uniref:C1 family peptidase n=1 Tax=Blastopirellula sp. J2-11 TaxID=2943192 RepID=UPI0021CA187C|nr:C1 family peptidase [Blastopirellula sp. J2-11]UUO04978.1 C1 family peptidase [Blastopirellula sp. J2-11]